MEYAQHAQDHPTDLLRAQMMHLVIGQTLYLGDPRATPVVVRAHAAETASFTVEITAFEDQGATWELPLWDVSEFLIAPNAKTLTVAEQDVLGRHIEALKRTIRIEPNPAHLEQTRQDVAAAQQETGAWLDRHFPALPTCSADLLNGHDPSAPWAEALESVLSSKGVLEIEQSFVAQFASNPNAGEVVKGHRIVLAEMGLCPYEGHVLRNPATFENTGARLLRRTHIVTRLAFLRVMLIRLGLTTVPLFRTIYSDRALEGPRNTGFVSATFDAEVAAALFASGQKTRVAATYWQQVPADRLFMSYYETPRLSARYQEAEAVLLFDHAAQLF